MLLFTGDHTGIAANTVVNMGFSGSSDSDGTIVSYSVVEDTATGVVITGGNTSTPSFTTGATAETYTFTVTVTDDGGLTDTASVTYTSVDAGVVTETSLTPIAAPVTIVILAIIWFELIIEKLLTAMPVPNRTSLAPVRFVPLIVTVVVVS